MKAFIVVFTFLLTTIIATVENQEDRILGVWYTEGNKAKVEIYKEQNKYFGKIIWSQEVESGEIDGFDKNNPKESLRKRKIVGLNILSGFKYDGDDVWEDGKIYDPENGKTYSCKMTLEDPSTLNVRGFIGFSLIGRTTVWKKVE